MDETVIRIPDLRVVFKDDVGAICFPNIKNIPLKQLIETYFALGDSLRKMPGVLTTKNGDIVGVRQN
jgi:hypothetical protein